MGLAEPARDRSERLKQQKYSFLSDQFIFFPFCIDTFGAYGSLTKILVSKLSKLAIEMKRDANAGNYFRQRMSLAVVRGNAATVTFSLK